MKRSLEKELEFKISLCYSTTLAEPIEIYKNNPIYKLLSKYEEIENIIKLNKPEIIKFLYFNRKNIEQKILYESEKTIRINSNMIKSLSNYFYLSLLINEVEINYNYSISFIKEINELKSNNGILKDIILSKNIVEIIQNFFQMEECEKNYEEELNKMKNNYINKIKENINKIKDLNLELNQDNIIKMNIEKIYIDIICSLIKTNKIDDFEQTYNIISQLDLENINITENMFNDLSKVVDANEDYMKNYLIEKIDDLFINKKINFYYILIKYILKNSFYIYQIDFLNKARITIMKIIISNSKGINDLINKIDSKFNKEQILYVIKVFVDSEYLFNKYISKKDSNYGLMNNEHSNNYMEKSNNLKHMETEKENSSYDIKSKSGYSEIFGISENLYNIESEISYKIMNNSLFKLHINKEGKLEYDEINYGNDNIKISYDELKNIKIENNETLKENFDKFLAVLKDIENQLETKFKSILNFHFDLLFKMKDNIDNAYYYNICCLFLFYSSEGKNPTEYKEEDILSSNSQNILSDLFKEQFENNKSIDTERSINSNYSDLKEVSPNLSINSNSFSNKNLEIEISNRLSEDFNIIKEYNKYNIVKIIQFKDIIAHHYGEAEFIVETSNGICISGSSKDEMILFNERHEKKKEFRIQNDNETQQNKETNRKTGTKWTLSLWETKKENQKSNELNLIFCSKIGLRYININIEKKSNKEIKYIINENNNSNKISKYSCSVYLEIEEDKKDKDRKGKKHFIIGGEKGIKHFSPIEQKIKDIEGTYRGGIKLNNYICAFTSNYILPMGKDKLVFYNIKSRKIIKVIENYSFTVSSNSLAKIKLNKNKSKKFLLCGCKKYHQNQKNGILLLELKSYTERFYDTDDFEVYCFCQISSVVKTQKKIILYPTNYFFVGGFDEKKQMGMIKLYRIIEEVNLFTKKIRKDIYGNIIEKRGKHKVSFKDDKKGKYLVEMTLIDTKQIILKEKNYKLYTIEREARDKEGLICSGLCLVF